MTTTARYASFTRSRTRIALLAETNDLTLATTDLDHIDPLFAEACHRMQDARAALPGAQSYDAPSVSGGSATLTGPERLADQLDRTQWDRDTLDRLLHKLDGGSTDRGVVLDVAERNRALTVTCRDLRRLIDTWTPRRPSSRDLRLVEKANRPDNPAAWCEHHKQADLHEPAEHHGTVSGNLDHPMHLCGYCYWQTRRKGKLPNADAMVLRQRTGKDEKEKV